MDAHVLIAEDDRKQAELLRRYFEREGCRITVAHDGRTAIDECRRLQPDVVVLDGMLPRVDGLDVCRTVRAESGVAILMLTARATEDDLLNGLDAGADDYLVKPFALEEMAARIRALLRRAPRSAAVFLEHGDIRLDSAGRSAERNGHHVTLTAREYAMLELFMRRPNELLTRDEISRHVWDDNYDPASNIIDVYVARLRTKLEAHGGSRVIHTMRGQGYIFRIQDEV